MNKKEFLEFQGEIGEDLYILEKFHKDGYKLDIKYTATFIEELLQLVKIDFENQIMLTVIPMLKDKKSKQEIDEIMNKSKITYTTCIKNMLEKVYMVKEGIINFEDDEELNKEFHEFAKNYHPGIIMHVTKEYEQMFNQVKTMYMNNNYKGYKAMMDIIDKVLPKFEVEEKDYNLFSRYYYEIRKNINTEIYTRSEQVPFTKAQILTDEIAIAREKGDLRIRLKKLTETNKVLHPEFIALYGEDLSLKQ